MFYLISEWIISWSSNNFLEQDWYITIERETFTKEEDKLIDKWYKINLQWELYIEEEDRKKIETEDSYIAFEESLKVIKDKYTDSERETFELKRIESEKVLSWGSSYFLESLCIEWESVEELALSIKANSDAYQTLYAQAEKRLRENLILINN